ncbi:MAG: alpha-1,2-fucosyltransferase [Lachnospiraceae bacterium]
MIVVRFTSGLGNQMFQYSFYRLMQETYPHTEVKADLTWFYANNDHHGYELERIFGAGTGFQIIEASKADIFKATGLLPNLCDNNFAKGFEKLRRYPNRILRELTGKRRAPYQIDQLTGDISNLDVVCPDGGVKNALYETVMQLDVSKNWYLTGFWIEEKYYRDRILQLRDELVFDRGLTGKNAELALRMRNENSVSIHVRRGDYLSPLYSGMFQSLGRDYYEKAVACINEHVPRPRFYLFSDDPAFAEKQFDWLPNRTIVMHNTGNDSYLDMQLMSLCKHNIIANSTFSQWGALLNKNKDHLTLYPAAYLKNQDNEEKTLPGWVRIS